MVKLKGNFSQKRVFLVQKGHYSQLSFYFRFTKKRFETNFWQLCLGVVTICNIVSLELKLCFRFMSK